MCLVTNYAPVVVFLLLLSLLSQLISRAQSQLQAKAKRQQQKQHTGQRQRSPNDTVIGHCFCPIICHTLEKVCVALGEAIVWYI